MKAGFVVYIYSDSMCIDLDDMQYNTVANLALHFISI